MLAYFNWLDQYIDVLQHFIASKVVLAPLLLLFLEEAGVPIIIPGDMIISYTGFKVTSQPGPGMWQAFITAMLAVLAGSTVLFFLSRRWGQIIMYKLGKFIFIKEKHIRQAERLFAKYGVFAIIIGRHIPGLRMVVTIFAGASGVRYLTFIVSTFISSAVWIIIYLSIGKRLGNDFHAQFQKYMGISFAVMAALTVGIVVLHLIGLYRESRRAKKEKELVQDETR